MNRVNHKKIAVAPADYKYENNDPAATFPIVDCHHAAIEPNTTPPSLNPKSPRIMGNIFAFL